jgi:O-antigen ligase
MDFLLFLLATAVLFLRPQDFIPEAATLPVYLCLLLAASIAGAATILTQAAPSLLSRRPITVCVWGLFVAAIMSHAFHGSLWGMRKAGTEFAGLLLYYLLLVGVVNTRQRLHRFLSCLAAFALIVTALALAQYHGAIALPQQTLLPQREVNEQTGEETIIPRLCGTGLFNDPNDLCLLLIIGMGIGGHRLTSAQSGPMRCTWLAAVAMLVYALGLTQSRGGFLAFLVGLFVLFHSRFGTRKAAVLAGVALPVLLMFFAGRQTSFAPGSDAGQDRIQLWSEALALFKEAPLFGIGQGLFEDRAGLVAHNSFVHSYAELGFFGGTLFLGAFLTALWTIHRLGRPGTSTPAADLQSLRPYLLAIIAGYATGMMFLSRAYIAPTYLILGLATVYVSLAARTQPMLLVRFDTRLVPRLAFASMTFLLAMHLFVRASVQRG